MRIRVSSGIWLLIGALICIIILVLALFLAVLPQRSKTSEIEDKISSVDASIQQERNRLNQLKQYEKDPEQFQRQIDALKERLPERVELADIIEQIDHAAEEAGLDFYSFKPNLPVLADKVYVVTLQVQLHGRYFNLIEFFNHVERLPRSFKVVQLNITESDSGLPFIAIDLTIRAFFTTDIGVEKLVSS